MSTPSPQPITVNFNVVIDASGNLEVFNAAAPVVTNVIVAEHTLPVTALYNPLVNKGLLELWEPESAQGDIYVQLADTDRAANGGLNFTGAYQAVSKEIAAGLEAILCDQFDCSGAAPFSSYTNNVEYYKQRDFGRVALATYAHHLFGHVDATAAITNDKAFVEAILSASAGGDDETADGAAARAASWTKSTAADIQAWDVSSSSSDANLALRLVKTLVVKGLDETGVPKVSSANAGEPDSLANIVSQVVGQDASRLMNVDNSQRTRDQHMLLRFYPGDIIYMNITLKSPNVSVGATNQLVSKAALEAMYPPSNNNFTLKITLSGPTQEFISTLIADTLQNIGTPANIPELKAFLAGFTASNPAPVQMMPLVNLPIANLVTNADSTFNSSVNYDVNVVLLTDNTATIDTSTLAENSILYLPMASNTPITLIMDSTPYTVVSSGSVLTVNGTEYNLGQSIVIGTKTFVFAFSGSVGLVLQPAIRHIFTNVIPDLAPDGSSLPTTVQTRYFKFNFTAPSNGSNINIFAKTNAFAANEERIVGLYAAGSSVNMLTNPASVAAGLGVTYDSTAGTIAFDSNLANVGATPNIILNSLVAGTVYSLITKTTWNDPDADVDLSFEANATDLPLTYVDQNTYFPSFFTRAFTNVISEITPSGAVVLTDGTETRYYKFNFTAPSDGSSINIFAKTNAYSVSEEALVGLYESGSSTNMLTIPTHVTAIDGVTYDSTAGTVKFAGNIANVGTTPNLTLNSLVPGNVYSFFTKTSSNDVGADVALSFETNSTILSLICVDQDISAGMLPGNIRHIYTNVIPDTAPNSSSFLIKSGTRYFKFDFTAPSDGSSINVFAKTNGYSFNEELIQGLYESGSTTNMLKTPATITAGTGVTYDSTAGTIKLANSLDNIGTTPNFIINSLVAGNVYSLFTRTIGNAAGADVALSFENNATALPITYVDQSTSAGILPVNIRHIYTNVIPDVAPNGSALPMNVSETRYFKFEFTAPSDGSNINVFAKTNTGAFTQEIIHGIYESGSTTNILTTPTNVTAMTGTTYNSTAGTIKLSNNLDNIVTTPNFTLNSLVAGTVYSFITKTTYNTAGEDVALSFENNSAALPITYVDQSTSPTIIPGGVAHIFTNVTPDVAPNGVALPINVVGIRYFKFNFTAPSSSINVFAKTNIYAFNEELITGLYEAGSAVNMLTNPTTITAVTGVTFDSTAGTVKLVGSLDNIGATPNFTLNSLVVGNVYSMITITTNNDAGADVGLSFENNSVTIPITYVDQSNTTSIIPV